MIPTLETVSFTRSKAVLPINLYLLGKRGTKNMKRQAEAVHVEHTAIDFFDVLKGLTTDPAITLLAEIIQAKEAVHNTATLVYGELTQVERNRISKGYQHLKEQRLVHRIKKGVYLVNPRLSPPYAEYFDTVCLHWLAVTGNVP